MSRTFLFSVDVEDPHAGAEAERTPLPELVARYAAFLQRHAARATFFVEGETARRHPEMIAMLARAGHEIACHSDSHVPLDRMSEAGFREDLARNVGALRAAGAPQPRGYRAPILSLTPRSRWVHRVLAELGFAYSSSLLPARNMLYGWPGFGAAPRMVDGTLELPVTLLPSRILPLPIAGGIYFRTLPRRWIEGGLRKAAASPAPVVGYLHPYDIDEAAAPHPGFRRWTPYGLLMAANRGGVMARLERVMAMGFEIETYGDYAAGFAEPKARR